jgi:hypothetical protein
MGIGNRIGEVYRGYKARAGASDAEMGINTGPVEQPETHGTQLADGPLWHAFGQVQDGVMGSKDSAIITMENFLAKNPDAESLLAGKTIEEARAIIAEMSVQDAA